MSDVAASMFPRCYHDFVGSHSLFSRNMLTHDQSTLTLVIPNTFSVEPNGIRDTISGCDHPLVR